MLAPTAVDASPRLGGGTVPGIGEPRSVSSAAAEPAERDLASMIDFAGIGVHIGRTPVLRGLDLTLDPGQVIGIVGANGSGKTTLLQLAASLHRPVAGIGRVLGADLCGVVPAGLRRSICLVGHEVALYSQLTLGENLQFVATVLGHSKQVADAALDMVGLGRAADRRVGQCSQGMLKRADLARALMARPKLLLLDEPHAGLDSAAGDLVDFLVGEVRCRGGGALVVSHDRARLDLFADGVLELTDGRLVPAQSLP